MDTGVDQSQDLIEDALHALDLDWGAAAAIVITHRHDDHAGGLVRVANLAPAASMYAGADDIPAINTPQDRDLLAVGTGDLVVGMEIVSTPGHTPGHISVFEPTRGILVAGDALTGNPGGVISGSNASFTDDMDAAVASVATLATLRPDVILFGHGEPVTTGAAAALADLADS